MFVAYSHAICAFQTCTYHQTGAFRALDIVHSSLPDAMQQALQLFDFIFNVTYQIQYDGYRNGLRVLGKELDK